MFVMFVFRNIDGWRWRADRSLTSTRDITSCSDAYVARHSSPWQAIRKSQFLAAHNTLRREWVSRRSRHDQSPRKWTITPQIHDCNHTILTSVTIVSVYGASLMQGSSRWWSTDRNNINNICSWSVVAQLSRHYFFFSTQSMTYDVWTWFALQEV